MERPKLLIWVFVGFCAAFLLATCASASPAPTKRESKQLWQPLGGYLFCCSGPPIPGARGHAVWIALSTDPAQRT